MRGPQIQLLASPVQDKTSKKINIKNKHLTIVKGKIIRQT